MKRTIRGCLSWALAAVWAATAAGETATLRLGTPPSGAPGAAAARRAKPPTGYAVAVKAAPALDGKIDDACWAKAPAMRLTRTLDGAGGSAQPTEVRCVRHGKTLYVAVRCVEPLLGKVRASRGSHDGGIWADDSIEIFLGHGGTYYHLGVNAAGSTYDGKGKDSSWDAGPGFKAAAGRGRSLWTLEIAIPLDKMAGGAKIPTEWIANFCRNRQVSGRTQEAAWSPTYSGNSHLPERFGRLLMTDPPKAKPKEVVEKERVTILPSAEGAGVVRFDLSDLPKRAKVHRADLRVFRTAPVDGRFDEALVDIEIYPLFSTFKAGGKAKVSGKPLAIRGPWFDCLDATDAVKQWAGGKTNGGFFVKACPFFDAKATCLDIVYEGKPAKVPAQATGVKAAHRSGQTFITWTEITDPVGHDARTWIQLKSVLDNLDRKGRLRYVVYRHNRRITARNIHQAEPIATVKPCSAWNVNGRSIERGIDWNLANKYAHMHGHWNPFCQASQDGEWGRDCPMDRLVITDGAKPLARTTGLYVHTPAGSAKAYYAVATMLDGVQNTKDFSAANTTGSVAETPAEPKPVLQKVFPPAPFWNYREKRYHYVRWVGPPYANKPSEYYNWSVGVPTVKTAGKHSLELHPHMWARSYWRTPYRVERDSIIVVPHDFPIPTWWYGYHESLGTLKSFKSGRIQPYTERRVLWFIDWVAKTWPVDRDRIMVTSTSHSAGGAGPSGDGSGCSGALHLGIRHPDVFNAVLPGHGANPDYARGARGSMQRLWGKVAWSLKTDTGKNVWDELNLVKVVADYPAGRELPLVTFTGRRVPAPVGDFICEMLKKGQAVMAFYDQWSGPKLIPVSASGTWPGAMIRLDVRKNRLMPTFGRGQAAQFRGGEKGNMKYTRLNLAYRFRTADAVDKADRVSVAIWRTDSRAPATTDITLRRLQNFKAQSGKTYAWTLAGTSGQVTVGDDKLITIRGAKIPTSPATLVVTPE